MKRKTAIQTMKNRRMRLLLASAMALASALCLMGAKPALKTPKVLVELPDKCNTPDGMTLDAQGDIILSCPNFNEISYGSRLVRIDKNNKLHDYYELPVNHKTEKPIGPMGLDFGPDGNLYLADFQSSDTDPFASRLMRLTIKDGKPIDCKPVADGFKVSNAVVLRGDYVYVSDTVRDAEPDLTKSHFASLIYRIHIAEFEAGIVQLTPGGKDPHTIATLYTANRELAFGADGLTFDKRGNLYCGNFGDGVTHKITFDASGKVATNRPFAKAPFMPSCDGIAYDEKRDVIYVADSTANAVQVIDMEGNVTTLAQNGDTDGADGSIDQVCEVLVRGDEVIISNMDWPFPGMVNTTYDKPHTMSVIDLTK